MIKLKSIISEEKQAFRYEREGRIHFHITFARNKSEINIDLNIQPSNMQTNIGDMKLSTDLPDEMNGNPNPRPGYLFVDYIRVYIKKQGYGYLLYKEALKYCQQNGFKGLCSFKKGRSNDAADMWEKLKTFSDSNYDYVDIKDLGTRLKESTEEEPEPIDKDRLYSNSSYLDSVAEEMGYKKDFNKWFWQFTPTLFHCTTPEKYELIKQSGSLQRRSDTRGLNNRGVGSAVFTTMEEMEVSHLRQSYGDIVLKINTKLMKDDGFMPHVSKEPEIEEAEKLMFVLQKLGNENLELGQLVDSSGGITEYTVIVYSNIPSKYLSLYD